MKYTANILIIFLAVYLISCSVKNNTDEVMEGETAASTLLSTWTVLGPEDAVIVRAIVDNDECPEIAITLADETITREMDLRAGSDLSKDFPITVCESLIPEGTLKTTIHGKDIPLPVSSPSRIVIIGDTGCRLKANDDVYQACNDPEAWPFEQIAESAAAWGPDLIIHVGDYYYRENECPKGNTGCEGSPFGDNWAAWDADYFTPVEALFNAAPLVMIRGNHENCDRGGTGWFLILDTTIESPLENDKCYDFSRPFSVDIGRLDLFNVDTAESIDGEAPKELVDEYASQFEELDGLDSEKAWLLLHHPMWGIRYGYLPDTDPECCCNLTLQTARKRSFPDSVELIISGHIHMFQYLNFNSESSTEDAVPPQLTTGGGGVDLYTSPSGSIAGRIVDGMVIESGEALPVHSFTTVEFKDNGLAEFTLRDIEGAEITKCVLRNESLDCGI